MECAYCGESLVGEEADDPRKDGSGDVMCDECWHDQHEYTCDLCEDYEECGDHQHEMLVVWETVGGSGGRSVEPGIYRIVEWPYWTSDMLSMWLHKESLSCIAALPAGKQGRGCGHLCRKCQAKIAGAAIQ